MSGVFFQAVRPLRMAIGYPMGCRRRSVSACKDVELALSIRCRHTNLGLVYVWNQR